MHEKASELHSFILRSALVNVTANSAEKVFCTTTLVQDLVLLEIPTVHFHTEQCIS